jgi:polysaccharide biosynthesis transport protein
MTDSSEAEFSPAASAPFGRSGHHGFGHLAEEGLGLQECWLTVRKRLSLVLGLTTAALLLAVIGILLRQPRYTATATLLIQPATPQVLDITQLVATAPSSGDHDFYATQEDLLRSPALAVKVVRALGLRKTHLLDPPKYGLAALFQNWPIHLLAAWSDRTAQGIADRDEAAVELGASTDEINRYQRMLLVAPVLGTQLVTVSFTATDPLLGARIANAHARSYIDWGLELRHQASARAQDFLRGQLVEIKQRVEASEAALNSYRHTKGHRLLRD